MPDTDTEDTIAMEEGGNHTTSLSEKQKSQNLLATEEGGISGTSSSGKQESQKLKKIKGQTPLEMLSGGVAVVAVGTSIAAMVVNPITPVFVAGSLSSIIGPYAYYQQTKLTDIIALKETQEALKKEVQRLTVQNERLNRTVGELSETIDKLEDVEQALDVITQTQGQSVSAFREQVQQNIDNLNEMEKNLRANVLQNLLQVVICSDANGDNDIKGEEIDALIARLKKINGVELREDRFKEVIVRSGGDLSAVMGIIKNLMMDDVAEEDQIFIIKDGKETK